MTFKPLFGQITILSLSFVTFRVSRFHVSYLTHETYKLRLQNTLNMSKTTRVYFGVLQGVHEIGSSSDSRMDEVKAIITLRSGKEIEQPVPEIDEKKKGKGS